MKLEITPISVNYYIDIGDNFLTINSLIDLVRDTLRHLDCNDILYMDDINTLYFTVDTGAKAKRVLQFIQQLRDKHGS